jgi:bacterioferritin-associated ferredoxin
MADELPEELKDSLGPLIETIAYVNEQIAAYDKEIEAVAKREYPETEKLRAVHGVGPVTALQFVLTLGSQDVSASHDKLEASSDYSRARVNPGTGVRSWESRKRVTAACGKCSCSVASSFSAASEKIAILGDGARP